MFNYSSSFKLKDEEIDERKISMKLLFLGDTNTGKTFIINSLHKNNKEKNNIPTIGLQYKREEYVLGGRGFYLDTLDTSGQEKYRMITYLGLKQRNFDGIVLVYSTKNKESFNNLESYWMKLIVDNINIESINLLIIGNKYNNDKEKNTDEVSEKEGQDLAKKYGATFIIYNSQDDNKIIQDQLIEKILNKKMIQFYEFGIYKIEKKTRVSYHKVCPYFSDTYTTYETYYETIFINRKQKKRKKNSINDDNIITLELEPKRKKKKQILC